MAKLTKKQEREITEAPNEKEKVRKAAAVMIEEPLDLIRCILQRHEEAVIEVMREQAQEIERLREGLRSIECEPINAECMARNILDGRPAYHGTMLECTENCECKVGAGGTSPDGHNV